MSSYFFPFLVITTLLSLVLFSLSWSVVFFWIVIFVGYLLFFWRLWLFYVGVLLCCLGLFQMEVSQRFSVLSNLSSSDGASFSGKIKSMGADRLSLRLDNGFVLRVYFDDDVTLDDAVGDVIRVHGQYRAPELPRNPGQFDYVYYAFTSRQCGMLFLDTYEREGQESRWSLGRVSAWVKDKIIFFHQQALPEPFDAMLTALVFGDSGGLLSVELKRLFQRSGLLHALVVSGSQVSLLLSLCAVFLSGIYVVRGYQLMVLVPVAVLFYFVTGGGESVFRAIVMALTLLGIKYFLGYRTSALHVLSVTAFVMLLCDPFFMFKFGAVLSFLATFSLIYGVDLIEKKLPDWMPVFCRKQLALVVSPWLFTSPFLLIQTHVLSLGTIVANFFLLFLIEWLVVLGFLMTVLCFVWESMGIYLLQSLLLFMHAIVGVAQWVVSLDGLMFSLPMWVGVSCFFLVFVWVFGWIQVRFSVLVGVCLVLGCVGFGMRYLDSSVRVTVLDVGQGDSVLIQSRGTSVLVDTGNNYDSHVGSVCESVLLPVLRQKTVNQLDMVMITHFDQDHVGNLRCLVEQVGVDWVIHNGQLDQYPDLQEFLVDEGVLNTRLCEGDRLTYAAMTLDFLQPCDVSVLTDNNGSLVMKLQVPGFSMLFTGDIELDMEEWLSLRYSDKLRSTVLKVAHHGSRTSSGDSFLSFVDPELSIISVGKRNRYHHPNEVVLLRLETMSRVFRTDVHGAVEFVFSDTVKVYSFLQSLSYVFLK